MTKWLPSLEGRAGPRYLSIAQALSEDVAAGRLMPGDRLPTHRDLGWRLGVTVGTVTRAYAEAERRGLLRGEVGRGTFVLGPATANTHAANSHAADSHMVLTDRPDPPGLIDLSFSFPPSAGQAAFLAPALEALAGDPGSAALLDYQPHAGLAQHRAAGVRWLALSGLDVELEQVVVTGGAHHGVTVCLAALTRPGDRVLTDAVTYPGLLAIARILGLRLEALDADREGLSPEAFDAACRGGDVAALYCIPTLHNPTTATLSEARRRALAEVAERHAVAVVEDDVFGLLADHAPPPLTHFAPNQGYFVTSLSKSVAPGLRVGYVAGPAPAGERLAGAVRATCWMATGLTAAIAARWINDGTARQILELRRAEAAERRALALRCLARWQVDCEPGSIHLWLRLPQPWQAAGFALEAQRRGVAVTPGEAFAIGRQVGRQVGHRAGRPDPDPAIRVCLGPPRSQAILETALKVLDELLEAGGSDAYGPFV